MIGGDAGFRLFGDDGIVDVAIEGFLIADGGLKLFELVLC